MFQVGMRKFLTQQDLQTLLTWDSRKSEWEMIDQHVIHEIEVLRMEETYITFILCECFCSLLDKSPLDKSDLEAYAINSGLCKMIVLLEFSVIWSYDHSPGSLAIHMVSTDSDQTSFCRLHMLYNRFCDTMTQITFIFICLDSWVCHHH